MKRIINLQKGVEEVTLVISFDDYAELMKTIADMQQDKKVKNNFYTKHLNEIKENIESIEAEYIWDEI